MKKEIKNWKKIEKIEKIIIDGFLVWYSTAWVNEEINEKEGIGLRDKFCGDFLRIVMPKIRQLLIQEKTKDRQMFIDALIWCSGSEDFQVGGKARKGWEKICLPLLK